MLKDNQLQHLDVEHEDEIINMREKHRDEIK